MHKQLYAILIALLIICIAAPAYAQSSRVYFAGYLGLSMVDDSDFSESTTGFTGNYNADNGTNLSAALGLRINRRWRGEAEISYRSLELDHTKFNGATFQLGGDVTSWIYMLNVYYDFDPVWENIQPFLTAGIGLAFHDVAISDPNTALPNITDDDINFAWQVGSGLKYRLKENLAVTGNYRYLATTNIGAQSYDLDYDSHEIRLGLEYDIPVRVIEDMMR